MLKQLLRYSFLISLMALGAVAQAQPVIIGYTNL